MIPARSRNIPASRKLLSPTISARTKPPTPRSEEHTSELQSRSDLVCRLLLEKKKEKDGNDRNVLPFDFRVVGIKVPILREVRLDVIPHFDELSEIVARSSGQHGRDRVLLAFA